MLKFHRTFRTLMLFILHINVVHFDDPGAQERSHEYLFNPPSPLPWPLTVARVAKSDLFV